MQTNKAVRTKPKKKSKAIVARPSVRRDTKLSVGRLSYKYNSSSRTLDAAIANCTRSLQPDKQVGVPRELIHDQYWNANRLSGLLMVRQGRVPFVVI